MRFIDDIEMAVSSIEDLYVILDGAQTSNTAVVIETSRGTQFGSVVLVDEQAVLEGLSGTIKACLVATKASSIICHVPLGGTTAFDEEKSPDHWAWTIACHLMPNKIRRHILGETICNDQSFKTTILQELGNEFLEFLPKVFQDLEIFLSVNDPNEIARARAFLEEDRPDWEWNWSQYDC